MPAATTPFRNESALVKISLQPAGQRLDLQFTALIPFPQSAVWQAITEPDLVSQWMPVRIVDMDLRPGGIGHLQNPDGSIGLSEITRYEPPRAFGFRGYANGQTPGERDNLVRFDLDSDGQETQLTGAQTIDSRPVAPIVACGWEACLAALEAVLGGKPVRMAPPTVAAFEHFLHELGLDQPTLEPIPGGARIRFERQTLMQPLAKVWSVLTGGLDLRVGDFAPPLFTGANASGRIAIIEPPAELEYLLSNGGRVRWRLHEHFGSTRFDLTIAVPRTVDIDQTAAVWRDHLEAVVTRIIAAD